MVKHGKLIFDKGMDVKEAIDFIKKKRRVIHLNKKQVNALKRFK